MAEKDADLASDYTGSLYLVEDLVAAMEVTALNVSYEPPEEIYQVELAAAGAPVDTVAPVISNMSPAPGEIPGGDFASAAVVPLEFDITDPAPGLLMVIITIKYSTDQAPCVVHDGSQFHAPFDTAASGRVGIPDGYHFTLMPTGGWREAFSLHAYAVDAAGNLEGGLP